MTMMALTATVLLTAMACCEIDDNDDDNDCDDDGDDFLPPATLFRMIETQLRSNWPRPCTLSFTSCRQKWKAIITPLSQNNFVAAGRGRAHETLVELNAGRL